MRRLVVLAALLLHGCAAFDSYTQTKTVVLTPEQLASMRQIARIEPCPPPTRAIALAVELASETATLTVRCQ